MERLSSEFTFLLSFYHFVAKTKKMTNFAKITWHCEKTNQIHISY